MLQYSSPIVRWLASCLVNIMYYQRGMQLLHKKKKNHLLDLEKEVLLNIGIQLPKFFHEMKFL